MEGIEDLVQGIFPEAEITKDNNIFPQFTVWYRGLKFWAYGDDRGLFCQLPIFPDSGSFWHSDLDGLRCGFRVPVMNKQDLYSYLVFIKQNLPTTLVSIASLAWRKSNTDNNWSNPFFPGFSIQLERDLIYTLNGQSKILFSFEDFPESKVCAELAYSYIRHLPETDAIIYSMYNSSRFWYYDGYRYESPYGAALAYCMDNPV